MYTYKAYSFNVVDGDTLDVEVDLGFKVYSKQRLRLAGLDTPERGQPGYKEAMQFVADCVKDQPLLIKTTKVSKFGYYLATIVLPDNRVLNDELIAAGLAKPYDGGKKE